MVEPRYTLSREAKSLKNRHMVKCYPSFGEKLSEIEEFQRKLKFYKELVGQQGNLIEYLYETAVENTPEQQDPVKFEIKPMSKSLVGRRCFPYSSIPRIDTESYLSKSSTKYNYSGNSSDKPKILFENMHESTLYINHYC